MIGQTHFSSLLETHAKIQQEESRRQVMVLNSVGQLAMVVSYPKFGPTIESPVEKESRECDYCEGKNNTRDRCLKLHGCPKGQGGQSGSGRERGSQVYVTTTIPPVDTSSASDTTTALTPEKISTFRKFYSKSTSLCPVRYTVLCF